MTGPEHYREGGRLLDRCAEMIEGTDMRRNTATEANAHFLAALVAATAEEKHPLSVAWQQAVGW